MRKQEIDYLRGLFIFKRSLCIYEHDFWDADACNLHLEMLVMQNCFEPGKLCNAHDIICFFFTLILILILFYFFILLLFCENMD